MKIDGSCHCGRITYEAEIDPESVRMCHCTDCQTLSGSAFRTVVPAAEDRFTLLSGAPMIYLKTVQSGARRQQSFCSECGSPIYATSVGAGPKVYGICLGTVRQRSELVPKKQYWSRSAQRWLSDLQSIQKIEKQ